MVKVDEIGKEGPVDGCGGQGGGDDDEDGDDLPDEDVCEGSTWLSGFVGEEERGEWVGDDDGAGDDIPDEIVGDDDEEGLTRFCNEGRGMNIFSSLNKHYL